MPILVWSNEYSVQIQEIDQQHKGLVGLINVLHDGMKEGKGNETIAKIVDEMEEYAARHFSTEERLMKRLEYSEYSTHKAEHDAFVKKVGELKEKMSISKVGLSVEVIYFLKDWLLNHILKCDKKYVKCFKDGGLK